jgi:hypothetical protein
MVTDGKTLASASIYYYRYSPKRITCTDKRIIKQRAETILRGDYTSADVIPEREQYNVITEGCEKFFRALDLYECNYRNQ